MHKFLIAMFAVFMLPGTLVATVSATDKATSVVCGNVLDKLVTLVKGYTERVDSAESIEELEALYAALYAEITEFTKKNATEIAAFDEVVTGDGEKKYKAALEEALLQFRQALEKRATQILL